MDSTTFRELEALERRGWDSLCTGTGADFYAELMTEDAVMVLSPGFVLDRAGVASSLQDAPPWDSYELTDVREVDAGTEGRALVYLAASRRGDQEFTARMSSVYRRIGERWRLVLHQQTAVSD
jgi:ketosteroid isomerase-like protein